MEVDSVLTAYLGDLFKLDDGVVDRAEFDTAHPVATFFQKTAESHAPDPAWQEPIGVTPQTQLSKAFLARSDARLERVMTKIRAMFGEHEAEVQEAMELVKAMFEAERAEVAA